MKIQILKDLPWAKVGEIIELSRFGFAHFTWLESDFSMHCGQLEALRKDGWIKFIDEKKTLKEKISDAYYSNRTNGEKFVSEVTEICRQHFLEALPEFVDPLAKITEKKCREAIREAK